MKMNLSCFYVYVFLVTVFLFSAQWLTGQVPQGMNYQAVARDGSGEVIDSQTVRVRFTIRHGGTNGPGVYQETQLTTTNRFGLFSVAIGAGTPDFGTFSSVDWASGSKFLQVEMDVTGGTNFVDMGTSQLLSVPFALYAQSSGNGTQAAGDTGYVQYRSAAGGFAADSDFVRHPITKSTLLRAQGGNYLQMRNDNLLYVDSTGRNKFIMGRDPFSLNEPFYGIAGRNGNHGLISYVGDLDYSVLGGERALVALYLDTTRNSENGLYVEPYQSILSTWDSGGTARRFENLHYTNVNGTLSYIRDIKARVSVSSFYQDRTMLRMQHYFDTITGRRKFQQIEIRDQDTSISFTVADQSKFSLPKSAPTREGQTILSNNSGNTTTRWGTPPTDTQTVRNLIGGTIDDGTYTPTDFGIANVSSDSLSVPGYCIWHRIKNTVYVSGMISINPLNEATATSFELSLPLATDLSQASQLNGFFRHESSEDSGIVQPNLNDDRARFTYFPDEDTPQSFYFQYTYRIQ